MGADGAATLGALGQKTVQQPVRKLSVIANTAIMGVSGAVGLGQRISGIVNKLWDEKKFRGASFEVMQTVRNEIGPMLVQEIKYATEAAKLLGQGAAMSPAVAFTLLAVPVDKELRLYQFGCTGDPEEATTDLPFVAMGSGQNLADPFLAFLQEIFWKKSQPNTSEGIFVTVWTLLHAIRRNTGGVAEPIQLMTIKQESGKPVIKQFDEAELEETRQGITEAEAYLSQFSRQKPNPLPASPA
jgi:20S proteasome alpha/beta subunit